MRAYGRTLPGCDIHCIIILAYSPPGCRAAEIMDNNEKDDFDLQGRLGCFNLSDLLQTFSFTQKTGTLTLIQGWNTRTICYEQGRIKYIAAATRLPTVTELMMQTGRLTVQTLEQRVGKDWRIELG